MEFFFDEAKTTQAASLLLEQHRNTMPCVKLVKLLYLADRQSLVEIGSPITGDRFVSLKDGPSLDRVLELIREPNLVDDSTWHRHIQCMGRNVALYDPAGATRLSRYELRILTAIAEAYRHEPDDAVVMHTQNLPEWVALTDKNTPAAIAPEVILRFAGRTDDEIDETALHAAESLLLRTLATDAD